MKLVILVVNQKQIENHSHSHFVMHQYHRKEKLIK